MCSLYKIIKKNTNMFSPTRCIHYVFEKSIKKILIKKIMRM